MVVAVPASDPDEVRRAAEQGRKAGASWAAAPALERAEALLAGADALAAAAEDIARLVVREVGKTIAESRVEVERGVRILRFHAEAALLPDGELHPRLPPAPGATLTMSRRRPRGVAG